MRMRSDMRQGKGQSIGWAMVGMVDMCGIEENAVMNTGYGLSVEEHGHGRGYVGVRAGKAVCYSAK